MKKIGITGGIGSGKTIVTRIFSCLGIPVFNADITAREIVNTDPKVKEQIIELLGESAFREGAYDRSYVASRVFREKHLLEQLNRIIHPATINAFKDWVKKQHAPYIIKEAAILFESGSHTGLDRTITVQAPEELRLKRVLSRDNVTEAQVRSRMLSQFTDEQRANVADHIIINDDIQPVIPQVLQLHQTFIQEP